MELGLKLEPLEHSGVELPDELTLERARMRGAGTCVVWAGALRSLDTHVSRCERISLPQVTRYQSSKYKLSYHDYLEMRRLG